MSDVKGITFAFLKIASFFDWSLLSRLSGYGGLNKNVPLYRFIDLNAWSSGSSII